MRRLITSIAITLLALAASSSNSQAGLRPRNCPTIRVSCPDDFHVGSGTTFTAEVANLDADSKLTYNWTVSAGTIVSGQGTKSIVVDTVGAAGVTITATVEVGGLPETCPRTASCSIIDERPRTGDNKIDEYGNITWSDEKARLDNFAIEMQNEPTARGYLICYGGKVGHAGEAQRRCRRAKNYVSGRRGVEPSRIVTADGGYRENLTVELWVLPAGATPPSASPTVDPREVRFTRGRPKGRARRR